MIVFVYYNNNKNFLLYACMPLVLSLLKYDFNVVKYTSSNIIIDQLQLESF